MCLCVIRPGADAFSGERIHSIIPISVLKCAAVFICIGNLGCTELINNESKRALIVTFCISPLDEMKRWIFLNIDHGNEWFDFMVFADVKVMSGSPVAVTALVRFWKKLAQVYWQYDGFVLHTEASKKTHPEVGVYLGVKPCHIDLGLEINPYLNARSKAKAISSCSPIKLMATVDFQRYARPVLPQIADKSRQRKLMFRVFTLAGRGFRNSVYVNG